VADAVGAVLFKDAADAFARRADARQVRRRLVALVLDVEHRF